MTSSFVTYFDDLKNDFLHLSVRDRVGQTRLDSPRRRG